MDDRIRQYEEDRLRREKLAYFQAARNRREGEEAAHRADQTIENFKLIGIVLLGVGALLWWLVSTKIGRIVGVILLLAVGALFGLDWLQNDAAVRAQARQVEQPQKLTKPQAGVDVQSDAEKVVQSAQQLAPSISPASEQAMPASDTAAVSSDPAQDTAASEPSSQVDAKPDAQAEQPVAIVASFDCSRAASKMEKLICSTPETANADRRLAAAYSAARAKSNDPDALKADERNWLANERNACSDAACLLRVTNARIERLSSM
ncbi:lysozyme inhibitor LprI family protein [Burkholderia vietnamiensis]|uniref:lysozyme inhibitor LprI family protein n=1 Tax=Burkholderia vietnamiensis TaxID=60552 RepID=UPI0026527304|nr:lysozyme inhibitor LprI family protein [Burkholderia vietnamiensis]MDN7925250.1 lysozyme inhibitor LprI family protein [Burkholderia vietnamiensis]